jgi:hypothetical protein
MGTKAEARFAFIQERADFAEESALDIKCFAPDEGFTNRHGPAGLRE